MNQWIKLVVCGLGVWMLSLGSAWSACRVPDGGEAADMSSLMQSGFDCVKAGSMEEAGKLYYALSVRMRALAYVDKVPEGTSASVKSLQKSLGAPVNQYLGGDLEKWAEVVEWARMWDQDAPWPEGKGLFAKAGADDEAMKMARERSRGVLSKMAADIRAMDKGEFYAKRRASGLEVPAGK